MPEINGTEDAIIKNSAGIHMDTVVYRGIRGKNFEANREAKKKEIISKNPGAKWLRFWEDDSCIIGVSFGRIDASTNPLPLPKSAPAWNEEITNPNINL